MKKKKIMIIGILLIMIFLVGFSLYSHDNIRFKLSYEYLNVVEYNNGKKIPVSIPLDNKIQYLSTEKLIDFLENGTGILYLGYNTCPWCRNIAPILIDTVRKNNIDKIYYADIHQLDISSIHNRLFELLDRYLEENSEGEKVLAVPDVYFLKKGKIIGHHIGTVDSYRNPYKGMSKEEKQELADIYQKYIEEMVK